MFQLYLKLFELANQIYRNIPLSLAGVQTALRRWNHLLCVWLEIHNRPVSLPDPVALRLRSPPTGLEQQQQQQQHCHLCHHRTTCGRETTLAPRQTWSLHTTWRHRYDKCNPGPHFWLIAFLKHRLDLCIMIMIMIMCLHSKHNSLHGIKGPINAKFTNNMCL